MRPDLSPATLALLEGGEYDAHWLVEVGNGSGTLIDVSDRVAGVSGALPSPDAPIGTLRLEFLREVSDDPATSLAPLIASDLNVLDDGVSYAPLLQVGRVVRASVALTVRGAERPVSGFYEVFRGRVARVGWGGWYGGASVDCNDQAAALQRTKSEAEYTYAEGTAVETAIQQALNNNKFASVVLSVPVATGAVLQGDYKPGLQKSVWEQVQALASSIGHVCWYRYDAAGVARLTLFAPERTKAASDLTFAHIHEVERLDVDEEEIGNVLYDQYTDKDGARQLAGPVEDVGSIAKYGGIRRSFFISEEEGSPVTTASGATGLLTTILPDLADPDAIASYRVPLFVFGECGVDLYTFPADDRHYDTDQRFAPFAIRFEHQAGRLPTSTIDVRGRPSGGSGTWRARRAAPGTISSEPVGVFALDLKEVGRAPDDSTVTFDGPWGARIAEVRTYEALVAQPYSEDHWPAITGEAAQGPFTSRVPLVFPVPPQGYARLVRVVGILADGTPGAIERLTILPTGTEPDLVTSRSVLVDDATGAAEIRVDVADRTRSIRYAYAVGSAPDWPSDAAVENGTVLALTGSASITLPAGTVGYLETIRVRIAAYTGASGTGHDGRSDHGPIVGAEDLRLPPDVSLEPTASDETDALGTYGVTVHDVAGQATGLYKYYRSGASAWVGPILVTATPEDGVEYLATVALEEDHRSAIKFRLEYVKNGSPGYVESASPPFDRGKIPDITILPTIDEAARTASAAVSGDYDTASVKIVASTSGYPSAATVRAASAINGRDLTAAAVGTLLSGLTAGQTVYYAAFGYSAADGGGNESSSLAVAKAVVGVVAPLLEVASETEVGAVGTFGVTVRDPSGVATGLYYRTKSGDADWSAWTLQTGTPAHGATYARTVTLVEDHLSFVEWRLDYTLLGAAKSYSLKSSGLDLGRVPDLSLVPVISETGAVSCEVQGDFDTASVRIAASITGYPADATVRAAAAINGRNIPAATVGPLLTLKVGETAYLKAFGYSEAGGAGTESSAAITAKVTRDTPKEPTVTATLTRSGTTATLTLTIEDLGRRISAIEWQLQTQGSTPSWSTIWSTSSGTPGSSDTLTRAQAISIPAGQDISVSWRVTFVDANGVSKTKGDTASLANLSSITKTLRIAATQMVPATSAINWFYNPNYIQLNTSGSGGFWGALIIPKGVTLTAIRARMYRNAVGDQASASLARANDDETGGFLATLNHSTTGWQTVSASLSELIGDAAYSINAGLTASVAASDARFMWVEVDYSIPDYSKTV